LERSWFKSAKSSLDFTRRASGSKKGRIFTESIGTFLEVLQTKVKFNYSASRKIELKMINSLNELKTKLRKGRCTLLALSSFSGGSVETSIFRVISI